MTDDCEIWHGDSRVLGADIEGPINCFITDPPYGMDYRSGQAVTPRGLKWTKKIENDKNPEGAIVTFLETMGPLVDKAADECDMYVFTRWNLFGQWTEIVNELSPFKVVNMLIWDKDTPGMGDVKANWAFSYECIIYAKKSRRELSLGRRSSIIKVPRVNNKTHVHPTQKPVPLIEILLRQSTNPGDLVVDPFSGSGSAIIAAKRLGRRGIGIEQDPIYFQKSTELLNEGVMLFD